MTKAILFVLFILVLALGQTDKKADEKDIVVLDNKSLEQLVLGSHDQWLIDFYAPWCGHCVKMADEWAKLATTLKGFVKVAKIDASKYTQFNDIYGLKGFPHIVFLPAGTSPLFYCRP